MNRLDLQLGDMPGGPGKPDRRIGTILVQLGRLHADEILMVLTRQRSHHLRFGDAAVELGLVRRDDVNDALARQQDFPRPVPWVHAPEVVVAASPMAPAAESIRTLRAQLALQWQEQRQAQLLAVLSATRGEGRTFVAANLAVAFAQMQERTLLVDMDLRHPRLHHLFRVDNRHGVSTLASGHSTGTEIQRVAGCDSLSLLPAGPLPPHPQELLVARSMTPVLEQMRWRYDIVIVDTPAFSAGADAQIVSAQTRQALLVSAPGTATRDDTERLLGACRQVGASVSGAVVNRR